jgi:hypothetical protein
MILAGSIDMYGKLSISPATKIGIATTTGMMAPSKITTAEVQAPITQRRTFQLMRAILFAIEILLRTQIRVVVPCQN